MKFPQFSKMHIHITFSLFLGYSVANILRKSLPNSWIQISQEFKLTKTEYGDIMSLFALIFGIGKLVGGILSDKWSCKILLITSICIASLTNFLIGISNNPINVKYLWSINGLFQGITWPCIAKIIVDGFPNKIIGTVWSILTSAQSIGALLSPTLYYILISKGWRVFYHYFIILKIIIEFVYILFNNRIYYYKHNLLSDT